MTQQHSRPIGGETIDAATVRVGIVSARWNEHLVARLRAGADAALDQCGVVSTTELSVAGCFELPLAASLLIESGQVDAVVALGVVIRGETSHYELVSENCARGISEVALRTGVPVGLGVLAVESEAQALERSNDHHNAGRDATLAALELAVLADQLA